MVDGYARQQIETATAIEKAATALESEASRLRDIAQTHRRIARRWRLLTRVTARAPHLVDAARARGSNDPFGQVAERLDMPVEFVQAHYANYSKAQKRRERRQRDREIVRLAKTGMTNTRIAGRVSVSASTVKRVLKAADLGRYARRS